MKLQLTLAALFHNVAHPCVSRCCRRLNT
uniref:Uncharacterized protein n=1 Tax=Anguilla anguilla TaxID=7936 RepID=A0A0E9QVD7_ANGAN